ncbi:MAG: ferritin family protein [Magnetococcales bacterium]|nr:ferritin family protein [Magnetococcales bacterium]
MKTFEELIQLAIRHELIEAAFYEDLAQRSQSEDQRDALLAHAREEMEHKRHLERILDQGRLPRLKRFPSEDLHLSEYAVVSDDPEKSLDYESSLLLAAKKEKATQAFYLSLAREVGDSEVRDVLEFLARQEGNHARKLEAQYDDTLKEG